MRKTMLLVASAAVILILVQLSSRVPAQTPNQRHWEYAILLENPQQPAFLAPEKLFQGKGGYDSLFKAMGGAKFPPMRGSGGETGMLEGETAVLELIGQGGWELVGADGGRVFFKRVPQ